jgi:2-keto-4-pentenoate hydratase/2-oxohepta-3-ene-1,7-dioic acid hydratase in catechol pathway
MNTTFRFKRFVRFEYADCLSYGVLEGETVRQLKGGLFDTEEFTGREYPLSAVKLKVPCEASKVIAVGLNYASHRKAVESAEGIFVTVAGTPVSKTRPVVFAKFPTCLIPHEAEIHFPPDATNVHFEGELALVIGKRAKNVPVDEARKYIFGVTICNDLVDREWLLGDLQWFRAKGSDDFGPVGPAIATGLDYDNLQLEARINGELRQSSNTRELVFSPDHILSYCSQYVTFMPGDLLFTGTPGETQQVSQGDTIEITIEHIGTLRNRIAMSVPA